MILNYTNRLILPIGVSLLLACGGSQEALISSQEIQTAQAQGRLSDLYQKADSLILENSGSTKDQAIALKSKIGSLLIDKKNQEVESLLSAFNVSQKGEGNSEELSVSRKDLTQLLVSIEEMKSWSATSHALAKGKIERAINKSNLKISQYSEEAAKHPPSSLAKIAALKVAAKLAGSGEPEDKTYLSEREQALELFRYQGSDGLDRRFYANSIDAAQSGLQLDPGNIQFQSMLEQAQAGLFEKDFRNSLESGKPESAYSAMMKVADAPIFLQLKQPMSKSILLLANYFASAADKAHKSGDRLAAYENFIKARNIQQKMTPASIGFIQEKAFVDDLMARAKVETLDTGYRLGLVAVAVELDPAYPNINSILSKNFDSLMIRAQSKISVADFSELSTSDSLMGSLGRRISSKLEKILFQQLGSQVALVSELVAATDQATNKYKGLSLRLDGEVLQAAIESNNAKGSRNLSVTTGISRVKDEDDDSRFIEMPIKENISLDVTHIRKQAIAEVAFRIIEPHTNSLLLTNNLVKENEFSGETINEFQKGDFHQPFKPADLPSNIKIMDTLALELADGLGQQIGNYLKSPETVFYQKYQEATARGDLFVSIEYLANAIALAKGKSEDSAVVHQDWLAELKQQVLAH